VQLGRVIGRIVCTVKSDSLRGKTLLLVQPLDKSGRDCGKPLVAVDAVGAGAGEMIYWCRGKEASMPWIAFQEVPTEATIVGIVDAVHLG
jgi:ethanolamine utilization protein EutN